MDLQALRKAAKGVHLPRTMLRTGNIGLRYSCLGRRPLFRTL